MSQFLFHWWAFQESVMKSPIINLRKLSFFFLFAIGGGAGDHRSAVPVIVAVVVAPVV